MQPSRRILPWLAAFFALAAGAWFLRGDDGGHAVEPGTLAAEPAPARPDRRGRAVELALPPNAERAVPPTETLPSYEGDATGYDAAAAAFDPARDRFFKPSARALPDCFKMLVDPRVNPGRKLPVGKEARDFCAIQERLQAEMLPLYWRYSDLCSQSLAERFDSGQTLTEKEAKAAMKVPGAIVQRRDGFVPGDGGPNSLSSAGTAWASLMPGEVPELDQLKDQIAALKERAALDMRRALADQ